MSDYIPDTLGVIGYNPETGKFKWLQAGCGRQRGRDAGMIADTGYVLIRYGGKNVPAHRLAWRIMTGKWPTLEIDHKNRVRHDNRFENLRQATRMQNAQNGSKKATNRSGYKGVHWHKQHQAWIARIMHNRKTVHLGKFDTREEAFAAYAEAAKRYHGEFHCLD